MPLITNVISSRRMRIDGHCLCLNDEIVHNLILWGPKFGRINRGRQQYSYIDNLKEDTYLKNIDEIWKVMIDRGEVERKFAKSKSKYVYI